MSRRNFLGTTTAAQALLKTLDLGDHGAQFAISGNVMDLAVGVMIGAAFQKIVDSLVNDVITPVIGTPAKATRLMIR